MPVVQLRSHDTDSNLIPRLQLMSLRSTSLIAHVTKGSLADDATDRLIQIIGPEVAVLQHGIDAVISFDDSVEANSFLDRCSVALSSVSGNAFTGAQALLCHRDGSVDLALPHSGISQIQRSCFPGFVDIAA